MRIRLISLAHHPAGRPGAGAGAWAANVHGGQHRRAADAAARRRHCGRAGRLHPRAAIEEANATASGAPYTIALNVSQISVPDAPPADHPGRRFIDGCGSRAPTSRPRTPGRRTPRPAGTASGSSDGRAGRPAVGDRRATPRRRDPQPRDDELPGGRRSASGAPTPPGSAATCFGRRTRTGRARATAPRSASPAARRTARSSTPRSATSSAARRTPRTPRRPLRRLLQHDRQLRRSPASTSSAPAHRGDPPAARTASLRWHGDLGELDRRAHRRRSRGARTRTAVKIGDAHETTIGGSRPDNGNVIAGNDEGHRPGLRRRPRDPALGRLRHQPGRQDVRRERPVERATARRRASARRLRPERHLRPCRRRPGDRGPARQPASAASSSRPTTARFTTSAAVYVGPGGDNAFIGTNIATPRLPAPVHRPRATPSATPGPAPPGIWIDGANDARIWRNAIGGGARATDPGSADPHRRRRGRRRHRRQRRRSRRRNSLRRVRRPRDSRSPRVRDARSSSATTRGCRSNEFDLPSGALHRPAPRPRAPGTAAS